MEFTPALPIIVVNNDTWVMQNLKAKILDRLAHQQVLAQRLIRKLNISENHRPPGAIRADQEVAPIAMFRESVGTDWKMMKELKKINTPAADILLVRHCYRSSHCAYSWSLKVAQVSINPIWMHDAILIYTE